MSAIKRQIEKDMSSIRSALAAGAKTLMEVTERAGIYPRRENLSTALTYTTELLDTLVDQGLVLVDFNEVYGHHEYELSPLEIEISRHIRSR